MVLFEPSTVAQRLCLFGGVGIGPCHLAPRLMRCELPFDPRAGRVALPLPRIDFGNEDGAFADTAIQTLTAQDTYLDFHHVQPTRVFRRVMKLKALENAVCFRRRESFI